MGMGGEEIGKLFLEALADIQGLGRQPDVPAEELLDTTYAPSGTLIDGLMGQGIYILWHVCQVVLFTEVHRVHF